MDHNFPEDIVKGFISSGNSAQAQCAKVVIFSLLPHDTKFFFERTNINIINSL